MFWWLLSILKWFVLLPVISVLISHKNLCKHWLLRAQKSTNSREAAGDWNAKQPGFRLSPWLGLLAILGLSTEIRFVPELNENNCYVSHRKRHIKVPTDFSWLTCRRVRQLLGRLRFSECCLSFWSSCLEARQQPLVEELSFTGTAKGFMQELCLRQKSSSHLTTASEKNTNRRTETFTIKAHETASAAWFLFLPFKKQHQVTVPIQSKSHIVSPSKGDSVWWITTNKSNWCLKKKLTREI